MPSENLHHAEQPTTQNQNNAMSNDPKDGHRLTNHLGGEEKTPVEKKPAHDRQGRAAIEEFGRDGMGVAPKE